MCVVLLSGKLGTEVVLSIINTALENDSGISMHFMINKCGETFIRQIKDSLGTYSLMQVEVL